MANTTWNPSDKSTNTALSGGNLIATMSAVGSPAVRSIDRQIAGKFYFEFTLTTVVGTVGFGIANAIPVMATSTGIGVNNPGTVGAATLSTAGSVNINGVNVTNGFSVMSAGNVACVALDLDNRLIWFRNGAAGNWNLSAGNNPATGVGGYSIAAVAGGGIPAYACCGSGNPNGSVVTANFGDSAFSGAVPAGFTSGFTAGASVSTNALTTQVAVEHWLAAAADAQVTQVAVEHWMSIEATYPVPSTPAMVLSGSRAGIGSAVLVQDNATRTQMLAGIGVVSQFVTATPTPPATGSAVRAIIMA